MNAFCSLVLAILTIVVITRAFKSGSGPFRLYSRGMNRIQKSSLKMDIDYPHSTSMTSFPPPTPSRKMTLDEVQRSAITTNDKAVIIVAGPGSGKTRVMSARLAYLLESGLCRPTEILVMFYQKYSQQYATAG